MYALALLLSAGTTAATAGLPYFHLGALEAGIPIQAFGVIVAVGVLIGAVPLRRYAEWHGVSDEHIRGLLTWVMVSGFLGAHEFDVIAYNWDKVGDATVVAPAGWWFLPASLWPSNWPLVLRIWDGISSYGGFIGGATGYALYIWWKRLPVRLFADITVIGLLPAFSIGRIGCTVVSDHIGAQVPLDRWYAFIAEDYPRALNLAHLNEKYPGTSEFIRAWNLGLIEFLYLVPVNILILWLAFRPSKRQPAGFVTVLTGLLYAPVRFLLDFLRPEDTDPLHLGLTFAQWSSILAFGVAVYAASRILRTGKAAETVAPTSRDAQARLRALMREDEEVQQGREAAKRAEAERKQAEIARARAERDREDAEEAAAAKAAAAAAGKDAKVADDDAKVADEGEADDEDGDAEDAAVVAEAKPVAAASKPAASKPGASKPAASKPGASKPAGSKPGGGKSTGKGSRKR